MKAVVGFRGRTLGNAQPGSKEVCRNVVVPSFIRAQFFKAPLYARLSDTELSLSGQQSDEPSGLEACAGPG